MKIITIRLVVLVACLAIASTAFGAAITGQTTIGGGTFTPSKGVAVEILSSATVYTSTSAHKSGTYEFCTGGGTGLTNGDPAKIYKQAYSAGGTDYGNPTDPTAADGGCGSGWAE